MRWFNEPRQWRTEGTDLVIVTDEKSDFWLRTYYGWNTDSGHVYGEEVEGDFTAEVDAAAQYEAHYDQCGLMLRIDGEHWLKAGVEYAHGHCTLSTVLTRGSSDWAVGPEITVRDSVRLRLTRRGAAVCVQWRLSGSTGPFQTLRLGSLSDTPQGLVGPMACSPTRTGLVARFTGFTVGPAVDFADGV